MAYYILNKYDVNSLAKTTHQSDGSYTYNDDSSITVIDYYGLLESGDTTYKNIDASSMNNYSLIDTITNTDLNISDREYTIDERTMLKFVSSINIRSIQRGSISLSGLAASGTKSVSISEIDMSKSFLVFDTGIGGALSSSYTWYKEAVIGYIDSYNSIVFKNVSTKALSSTYPITVTYQVIEFM